MISFDLAAGLVAATLIFLCLRRLQGSPSSGLSLPPGPRKLPFIGNLLDMPTGFEWLTYEKWGKEFNSGIIHIDLAGTSVIVVNTAEVAWDLFEKRSSLYSSRSRLPMVNELMGWAYNFGLMPYGSEWRAHRRLFHQEFHPTAILRYRPHQLKATHDLLRRLLDTPEDFLVHIRHMIGAIVMSVTYGIKVLPSDDPYIAAAKEALHPLSIALAPGAFLVDSIPLLKYVPEWLPGAGFKRKAKHWRKLAIVMFEMPFAAVKRNIAEGVAVPSFTSSCLERLAEAEDNVHQERLVQSTAAAIYTAGSDTLVASLDTFLLAILENPEAQVKAHQELDSVLGNSRLPDFDDKESLPYVTAIVKESLRWRNVLPFGVPHSLIAEDVYNGYRIPADSIVISNVWAILHDENAYPDPFSFKPERFLKDGKLNPDIKDPMTTAFGFGRRICPGRYMAMSSLWIAVASMLATFHFSKAVDESGTILEPSHEYVSGLVTAPVPFKCSIKPRSRDAENLVRATMKAGRV